MSFTSRSDDDFGLSDFWLISTPGGYDEPEILLSSTRLFCLKGADAGLCEESSIEGDDELTDHLHRQSSLCREPFWLENIRFKIDKAIKRENFGETYSHV